MRSRLARAGRTAGTAALLALLAVAPAAAGPLSLSDVSRLLAAGIGQDLVARQARRSGLGFELGVEEMLALREAGAGDALLAALLDVSDAPATAAPEEAGSVRVYLEAGAGSPALVLTNLDPEGRRLDGEPTAPLRGVISASERPGGPPATAGSAPAVAPPPAAALEVTVRREDDGRDERLARLEERLGDLESAGPEAPPVGADLPRHPINDLGDHPVLAPWGWGAPVLVPFAFEPQEFQVIPYGPSFSFTAARQAGFDPFRPVPPCTPGVACSVQQRLAHP